MEIEGDEDVEMETDADEEPVARKCGCVNRPVVIAKLAAGKKRGFTDRGKIIQDVEFLTLGAVNKMCWPHLRRCAAMVGLKTQVGGRNTLVKRVDELWKRRFQFREMVTANHDWFAKTVRGASPDANLGTLRFQPTELPPIIFDNKVMLERFMGRNTALEWEEHGTTVVKGAMRRLFADPDIAEFINHEIYMHMHHRRMVNGQKSLGWLRSAYFTQIQQIARQDPGYYAFMAITSGNLWQISFLYYLKATLPGDRIAFQHIDLNVKRFLECGRGLNRIQTSLTLTQENEENCTFVVPGFHRKLRQWWKDVVIREDAGVISRAAGDHNGNCLKINDLYRIEDKERYGDFVPAVCGPGDIHVSRPEIIHGSTLGRDGKSGGMRWVVNPWFVGIQSDHETRDIPESGSWSTIASYHRSLEAPKTMPSGQSNSHGYLIKRFAASIPLRHISHISDALVGLTRWDDPMVKRELAVLLGSSDSASRKLVRKCRKRMIKAYKANMAIIRELEIEQY